MGLVLPEEGYLEFIRKITRQYDILLVFDEVITGFRAGLNGAQGIFGIKPDLTTLGKIIGGGLPVGAFGGRRDIMELLAPEGDVYQAGTLSGNPLAMRAGFAVLSYLKDHPELYLDLTRIISDFTLEFRKQYRWTINSIASMFTIFFTEGPVRNFKESKSQDIDKFREFYRRNFSKGILLPPSPYETSFISEAHRLEDLLRML